MIFAAGIGSRLKPWTDFHPKALVPVGGVPMLVRVIDRMVGFGVSRIVVNVHHFADQIKEMVAGLDCPVKILISDETDRLLDTGGGLVNALPLIGHEDVLIHNADVLDTVNASEMLEFHRASGADVTLLVDPRLTTRRFVFSQSDRLKGWTNSETGDVRPAGLKFEEADKMRAFDGMHVISHSVFESLRQFATRDVRFSITDFYIENADRLNIMGYDIPSDARWFDVGKPETLRKAEEYIKHSTFH